MVFPISGAGMFVDEPSNRGLVLFATACWSQSHNIELTHFLNVLMGYILDQLFCDLLWLAVNSRLNSFLALTFERGWF